jgi:hypothetical protein
MRRDNKPGSGCKETPDVVVKGEEHHTAIWFKPRGARPPKDYDVSVPHRNREGWVVYFKYLIPVLALLAAVVVRYLAGQ